MGLRGCAAILLSEAIFSGCAGYWSLSIGTAVLFVFDSFTMIETEMPFRDPRVWESFGMTFGDRDASFGVQVVAQDRRGYVTDLMAPLDLSYKLPKSASERFGFTVEDEMLSLAKEQRMHHERRPTPPQQGFGAYDARRYGAADLRDSAAAHAPASPAAFSRRPRRRWTCGG
jgi:hypothetical protein